MLIFQRGFPPPALWSEQQFSKFAKKLGITVAKQDQVPSWPPSPCETTQNLMEVWETFKLLDLPTPPTGTVELVSDYKSCASDNLDWTKDGEDMHCMTFMQIRKPIPTAQFDDTKPQKQVQGFDLDKEGFPDATASRAIESDYVHGLLRDAGTHPVFKKFKQEAAGPPTHPFTKVMMAVAKLPTPPTKNHRLYAKSESSSKDMHDLLTSLHKDLCKKEGVKMVRAVPNTPVSSLQGLSAFTQCLDFLLAQLKEASGQNSAASFPLDGIENSFLHTKPIEVGGVQKFLSDFARELKAAGSLNADLGKLVEETIPELLRTFPDYETLSVQETVKFWGDVLTALKYRCTVSRASADVDSALVGADPAFSHWHTTVKAWQCLMDELYSDDNKAVPGTLAHLAVVTGANKQLQLKTKKTTGAKVLEVKACVNKFREFIDPVLRAVNITAVLNSLGLAADQKFLPRLSKFSDLNTSNPTKNFLALLVRLREIVRTKVFPAEFSINRVQDLPKALCPYADSVGVKCPHPGFAVAGGKPMRNHMDLHKVANDSLYIGPPPAAAQNHGDDLPAPPAPQYLRRLMAGGNLIRNFELRNQIGDGYCVYRNYFTFMHLYFRKHHKTTYAAECMRAIIKRSTLYTERQAKELEYGQYVPQKSATGVFNSADFVNEQLNKQIKPEVKKVGKKALAELSNDKNALEMVVEKAMVLHEFRLSLENALLIRQKKHSRKRTLAVTRFTTVVEVIQSNKLWSESPNPDFPVIPGALFDNIDLSSMYRSIKVVQIDCATEEALSAQQQEHRDATHKRYKVASPENEVCADLPELSQGDFRQRTAALQPVLDEISKLKAAKLVRQWLQGLPATAPVVARMQGYAVALQSSLPHKNDRDLLELVRSHRPPSA